MPAKMPSGYLSTAIGSSRTTVRSFNYAGGFYSGFFLFHLQNLHLYVMLAAVLLRRERQLKESAMRLWRQSWLLWPLVALLLAGCTWSSPPPEPITIVGGAGLEFDSVRSLRRYRDTIEFYPGWDLVDPEVAQRCAEKYLVGAVWSFNQDGSVLFQPAEVDAADSLEYPLVGTWTEEDGVIRYRIDAMASGLDWQVNLTMYGTLQSEKVILVGFTKESARGQLVERYEVTLTQSP